MSAWRRGADPNVFAVLWSADFDTAKTRRRHDRTNVAAINHPLEFLMG